MYLDLSSDVLGLSHEFETVLSGLARYQTHVLLRRRIQNVLVFGVFFHQAVLVILLKGKKYSFMCML